MRVILFDQNVAPYRESIYLKFAEWFSLQNIQFKVFCDQRNNYGKQGVINSIEYSFSSFNQVVIKEAPDAIILFVLMRYKFLLPFMMSMRIKKLPTIVWSHGINLKKREQFLMNQLYFLRQKLASALVLYSSEQFKYIKADHKKVFVAPNTLNFDDMPDIPESREELKQQLNLKGQIVILSVARFNVNKRRFLDLVELAETLDNNVKIIAIGGGASDYEINRIEALQNFEYLGAIYDEEIVSRYYKMADVFVMPGMVGLAINHAFHYGVPVILKNIDHGPELTYLVKGENGELYNSMEDLKSKIEFIVAHRNKYSASAIETIKNRASLPLMFKGFIEAIQFVCPNFKYDEFGRV